MTPDETNKEKEQSVWEIIPLSDFTLPSPPVIRKVRKLVKFSKDLLKNIKGDDVEPSAQKLELEKLPASTLDLIVPAIDWEIGVSQFQKRINEWLDDKSTLNQEIITFIGPPYSGYEQILKKWAKSQNLETISPPNADQILSSDKSWFKNPNEDKPWIFPNLENAFFRHTEGLALIRDFLDKAYSGALGKGIIGCNSWTWVYLNYLWHVKIPHTFSLQAFDKYKLSEVFYSLAKKASDKEYVFRQSDNGKYIFSENNPDQGSGEKSDFLQSLAAYCRGNLGVAYDFWYSSPRFKPDEILSEEDEKSKDSLSKFTVWITPWNQINKPILPSNSENEKAMILHTLLIHNGLPYEILKDLLTLSPNQIKETLTILEEAEILGLRDGKWSISAAGYPAVREFIHSNYFLIDQF